jgi:MSHA biogenesis protein MshE
MAEAVRNKRPERIRLGDLLLQQKLISQEQLKGALEDQARSGRKLGRVLIESGYLSEDQIGEALARQLGVPFINSYYNFNATVTRKLPEAQVGGASARRCRGAGTPSWSRWSIRRICSRRDPRLTRKEVNIAIKTETLLQTVDRIYRRTRSSLAKELGETWARTWSTGESVPGAEDAPDVKLLQTMFEDGPRGLPTYHIESRAGIAYPLPIDGLLQKQTETEAKISGAAQRLKLMSGLDISERRLPQDGRFNVKVRNQQVDVRISTMPTQYGETVVMRLLHRGGGLQQLSEVGLAPDMLQRFTRAIHRSTGMVLVTGPTGSGKTTTLYAALNELNTPGCKIITVEDPVEYRLDGLNQSR